MSRPSFPDPESTDWTWFPIDAAPKNRQMVIVDRWWVVHPEKGLPVYKGHSPQCNASEMVTRLIASKYPWAEVRFIPIAYVTLETFDER